MARLLPRFRRYLNYLQKGDESLNYVRVIQQKKSCDVGAELLCHGQEHYPAALLPFDDAPFILTVKGHTSPLNKGACAIFGAHNASINAVHLASKQASEIG